jgi:hypothetical protein
MRLDPNKINDRIQKLEEIKRIASDPELVKMLFEFIDFEETQAERPRRMRAASDAERAAPATDEAGELMSLVAKSVGA